jgi:hypothetical protein
MQPQERHLDTRERLQARDRLKGHPQERQRSDGEAVTRDRVHPARGTISLARGMEVRRTETGNPGTGSKGLGAREPGAATPDTPLSGDDRHFSPAIRQACPCIHLGIGDSV